MFIDYALNLKLSKILNYIQFYNITNIFMVIFINVILNFASATIFVSLTITVS